MWTEMGTEMGTEVEVEMGMEVGMEVGEVGMIEMGGGGRWGAVGTELCCGQAKSSRRTARDLSSVLSDVWKER